MEEVVHSQQLKPVSRALPMPIPIGKGFKPDEIMCGLEDPDAIKQIDAAKNDFRQFPANRQKRSARDEKPYICKASYLLKAKGSLFTDSEVISLLADSSTLFSRDYQVYHQNHGFYVELRNQQKVAQELQRKHCREQALNDAAPPRQKSV